MVEADRVSVQCVCEQLHMCQIWEIVGGHWKSLHFPEQTIRPMRSDITNMAETVSLKCDDHMT